MDNYVDCSQCPGIYGRTTAIYDRVEDTNENRLATWNRLAVATNNANFWPWFHLRKFSADQFWKECIVRDVCWNICNSSRKLSSSPRKLSQKIIFYFQTFCFIEKEWWKLWDKTKWINMVSWQFCHLQVVNLQNCTKWPACKVTMDIPSNFQVKSNSTWFTLLVPRDWTWMLVFVWSVFRCICSHTCLLILFGSQMYFYLMFIVLLFTDPIWYSYARFQKCEMWWKDYLMHKNNPTRAQSSLKIGNGNVINWLKCVLTLTMTKVWK